MRHQGWWAVVGALKICVSICFICNPNLWASSDFEPVGDSFDSNFRSHPPGNGARSPSGPSGEILLRVLNYNIHGIPLVAGIDHSRYADIGAILKKRREAGTAPQIVVIEEAFHSRTEELVRNAGYPYLARGLPGSGIRVGSGLLVFSEYPIVINNSLPYARCVSWDCLAHKGVQHVRVDLPGVPQPLEVLNTHMNSDPDSDFWTPTSDTEDVRYLQTQEYREFVWDKTISEAPQMYLGDFNFASSGDDYEMFVATLSARNAVEECSQNPRCVNSDQARSTWPGAIDHQFYRQGTRVKIEPVRYDTAFHAPYKGRLLSDHDGIEIVYRIKW